jgi:broad specificity phosphatase PhoE
MITRQFKPHRLSPTPTALPRRLAGVAIAIIAFFALALRADAGLKIYYLRHAEGGHNVVKQWAKVPKEQRPDYVGNGNVFTPKGKEQVAAATEKLQKYHFDFIAVSSMWRTRNTVLPYLKVADVKGEIWPELHEFGGGGKVLATNLPKVATPVLGAGARVELPSGEAPHFTFRPDAQNDFKLPAGNGDDHEAATQLVVQRAADLIREHFSGKDKTILLVGHGNAGVALLRKLTNQPFPGIPAMANAELWMVEQQPDGSFQLEMYNDTPCGKDGPAPAPTKKEAGN